MDKVSPFSCNCRHVLIKPADCSAANRLLHVTTGLVTTQNRSQSRDHPFADFHRGESAEPAVSCCVVLCPAVPSPQDASSSLERLRTDLRSWTTRVEAGELQNIGQKKPSAGELKLTLGVCSNSQRGGDVGGSELMLAVCSTSRRGGGVGERLGGGVQRCQV